MSSFGATDRVRHVITVVGEADLAELLPLMRGYCDFYRVSAADEALLTVSRALTADPEREGVQLLATVEEEDVGFATLFWSWATLIPGRIGVMNDLYVAESSRRRGVGTALIAACVSQCRDHGAARLTWQTAHDNLRAQAVYEHIGATRESWVDYWLDTSGE